MGIVISTHLPPPVMIERTEILKCVTHMLCWTWAMYFSAAASSENDHGSMNLASNTASVPSTMPSRVAAIQGMAECLTRRCTSRSRLPVLRHVGQVGPWLPTSVPCQTSLIGGVSLHQNQC